MSIELYSTRTKTSFGGMIAIGTEDCVSLCPKLTYFCEFCRCETTLKIDNGLTKCEIGHDQTDYMMIAGSHASRYHEDRYSGTVKFGMIWAPVPDSQWYDWTPVPVLAGLCFEPFPVLEKKHHIIMFEKAEKTEFTFEGMTVA